MHASDELREHPPHHRAALNVRDEARERGLCLIIFNISDYGPVPNSSGRRLVRHRVALSIKIRAVIPRTCPID